MNTRHHYNSAVVHSQSRGAYSMAFDCGKRLYISYNRPLRWRGERGVLIVVGLVVGFSWFHTFVSSLRGVFLQ